MEQYVIKTSDVGFENSVILRTILRWNDSTRLQVSSEICVSTSNGITNISFFFCCWIYRSLFPDLFAF